MSIKLDLSENITGYKEDLDKDLQTLETEINSISISLNIISKPQINKIESLFSECESNMRHIEVELSLMPIKTKEKFASVLKNFQDKIIKFKRTYNELRVSRNKLDKIDRSKNEASSKLLKVSETLDEGTNMMGESIRTMINVNHTDKDTTLVLKKQTETIKNTTQKLQEADGYVQRSELVLRNMIKRIFTNKLVLFALIILLATINIFLLYIKIKYNILGFKK